MNMADINVLHETNENVDEGKELRYPISKETMEDIRNNKPLPEKELDLMCNISKYRNWIHMRYQFLKDNAEEFKLDEMRKDATLLKELLTANMICRTYFIRYYNIYRKQAESQKPFIGGDELASIHCHAEQFAIENVYQEFICSPDVYYVEFDNWANMTEEEYLKIEDEY